jgi:hypothetical protein
MRSAARASSNGNANDNAHATTNGKIRRLVQRFAAMGSASRRFRRSAALPTLGTAQTLLGLETSELDAHSTQGLHHDVEQPPRGRHVVAAACKLQNDRSLSLDARHPFGYLATGSTDGCFGLIVHATPLPMLA